MIRSTPILAGIVVVATVTLARAAVYEATVTAEADAYVHGSPTNDDVNFGSSTELFSKRDDAVISFTRKIYFRVDANGLEDIANATVDLRVLNSTLGGISGSHDYTFSVYGLNPGFSAGGGELGEDWGEGAITWNNAPGNDTGSPSNFDATDTTFLGTFSPTVNNGGTTGDIISLSGASGSALVNFLKDAAANGTDGKATFGVLRSTNQPNGSNTVVHKFASREYTPSGGSAGDWAPAVTVNETAAHERFDYSPRPTELDGQNGGTGFDAAWSAAALSAGTDVVTPSTSLDYVQGGVHNHGGNHALSINPTNASGTRSLDGSLSDDVYVSFMVRLESGTLENNDFIAIGLGANDNVSIGIKANNGGSAGPEDFYVRTNTGNSTYAGEITLGDTFFIVGRLFKDDGTGVYDGFDLWVNPDFDDMGNPLVTATGDSDRSIIDGIFLRTVNLDTGDEVLFDELRIGTTWRGVVPVPTPAALPTGLILIGLAAANRRR